MKRILFSLTIAGFLFGCEDNINVELAEADPILAVDAWLEHRAGEQQIILQYTRPYFDNFNAEGIQGASVRVLEIEGTSPRDTLVFSETEEGVYSWSPEIASDSFGTIGNLYVLEIVIDGKQFLSQSRLNAVPTIDSITFRQEDGAQNFIPDFFAAEFWSRDLPGEGDTYWIKTWKNGEYLNQPSEINIAYDAGFSQGAPVDNILFIQPIRDLINPFDEDPGDDFQFLPPYEKGDSVYVQIQSINYDVWFFLTNVIDETNRPGGFGELFATPLSNVHSNIVSQDENEKAVGIFCVSALHGMGRKFTDEAIRVVQP